MFSLKNAASRFGDGACRRMRIRSDLSSSAVDKQFGAGDEAGVVGREKQGGLRDLVGLSDTAHRNRRYDSRDGVRRLPVEDRGLDRTRAKHVGADSAILELDTPRSNEIADGSLGRAVNPEGGRAFIPPDRTGEDDGAAVIQHWQGFLYREERALHVDGEQPVEVLLGDASQGRKFGNARICEDDVDPSPRRLDSFVETVEVGEFGNVSLNTSNITADRVHGLVEFILAASRDENERALFDEEFRRRQSYSRGSAGDDGDLALQFFHSICSFR